MTDHPSAQGGREPPSNRRDRAKARYRRVFWISLGVSALAHFLVLALYPTLIFAPPASGPFFQAPGTVQRPEGTELVTLVEVPVDPEPDVLPPEEIEDAEVPEVEVTAPDFGGADDPNADLMRSLAPGPTAAERLRPRAGDLRLWAPVDPEITALREEQLMQLLLSAELEDLADSMAFAEEISRRATDWTYTDSDGKRWGVSPGKLHLGDLTIPLPFGFSAPPMVREQNADRLWAWDDINQAAGRKAVQEVWKERAEAIRRRLEAERNRDTTRVRRRPPPGDPPPN